MQVFPEAWTESDDRPGAAENESREGSHDRISLMQVAPPGRVHIKNPRRPRSLQNAREQSVDQERKGSVSDEEHDSIRPFENQRFEQANGHPSR
jgi:hypothetical protein